MTDTNALKLLIKEKGLKYSYIAKSLGISSYALQQKICNVREFKATEIQKLCIILGIEDSLEQKESIFFAC